MTASLLPEPLPGHTDGGTRTTKEEFQDEEQTITLHAHGKRPPRWLKQRSSVFFVNLTCSYAFFVDIFQYCVIVPVFPFALQSRVGIAENDVQYWISTLLAIYGAGIIVGSPFVGWWIDRTKTRQWPFLLGLLVLLGATFMLCFGHSIAIFVVGRLLQGIAAGFVSTITLAIMMDRVGAERIGESMGYLAIGRSVAAVLGPLLGGIVYKQAGYYGAFGMSFGVIALDIAFRCILIDARAAAKWDPSICAESSIIISQDTTEPTQNAEASGSKRDVRTLIRRLPPVITLLSSIRLLVALWGIAVQCLLLGGLDAVLAIFVKDVFRWDSSGAGLIFLSLVIPTFISPLIGMLSDRHGPRYFATAGYLLCVPVIVCLRFVTHSSVPQKVLLAVLLALSGAFMTLFEIPVWVDLTLSIEERVRQRPAQYGKGAGATGQGFGLATVAAAIGFTLGPLFAGFIYNAAGWATMCWAMGLMFGVSAIPTFIWTGGYLFEKKEERRSTQA